ncbi:MAG TPA: hypothetical protein VFI13_04835, partial [Gemmatimonadales bacterium]|nr:hypothetical protein [Gemmatimonadales bacterium]
MLPFLMIAALAQAAPLPSCATTFDSLRAKVEADYAGYILEVTGARRQTYEQVVGELHAAAGAATTDLECLAVL